MDQFGLRLKEERKTLGLSQHDFAAMGGIAANAQGRYETGKRLPKLDYLVNIRQKGVDVLYVLTGQRAVLTDEVLTDAEKLIIKHYRSLDVVNQNAIAQITLALAERG